MDQASEDRVRHLRTPLLLTALGAALAACAPVAYEAYPPYGARPYAYAPTLPPPVPLRPQPPYGWDGGRYAPPSYTAPYGTPDPATPYPGPSPYAAPAPTPYGERDQLPGQSGPYASPYAARPYPDGVSPYAAPADPYRDDGNRYGYRPDTAPEYGQPNIPPYVGPSYQPDQGGSGNPPVQRQDVPPPSLGAPTWR